MPTPGEPRRWIGPAELSIAGGIAVAILMVIVARVFNLREPTVRLLEWIQGFGAAGALVFMTVDALAVVFLLPSLPLTLGAGFIFGVGWGSLYCLIARTIGSAIGFLIARYTFSAKVSRYVLGHEKLQIADTAISEGGGRIVFLTRLVPLFPGKLSNYFFGLTRCPLAGFCVGTFFGMIPLTLSNTYMGSLAGDLATLGVRDHPRTPMEWALDSFGLIAALAAAIALAHFARTQLRRYSNSSTSG